jgi:hypothetical protein
MKRKWRGRDGKLLPAHQVEPYRLWFEFLKIASIDPSLTVDKQKYISWGNFENQTFDSWWSSHWKQLFAIDLGVRQITSLAEAKRIDDRTILLSVPLYQSTRKSVAEIRALLDANGASDRITNTPQGGYHITVLDRSGRSIDPARRFLRNLSKIRLYLRIYRYWVEHRELEPRVRLEQVTLNYFRWAKAWNTKVREKRWNRPIAELPGAIINCAEYLEKRGSGRIKAPADLKAVDVLDDRRQITRYIRKACAIASNVAEAQFPGKYE